MTEAAMKTWQAHTFSSGPYTGEDYLAFQRAMRTDLNKQLKSAGLTLKEFNKNHYCFSAIVTDGEQLAYISVGDVRWNDQIFDNVLYRAVTGNAKDFCRNSSHYCKWNDIAKACKELWARTALQDERS